MTAGSILPVSIVKGQLYFLFGKENSMEDSHKGFSDFGGGTENDETPYDTAIREGAEETTFFLGDKKGVKNMIRKAGGFYPLVYNDYHVHLFYFKYDENLPKYYNNNHLNLWKHLDKKYLNNSRLFEKIEIKWFSLNEMRTKKKQFRKFYREIVDKILEESDPIRKFICSKKNTSRKTSSSRTKKNKSRKNK
jgi:8-oxo-dGTP pyrophosphatase MutT (NUDIX family)